MKGEIKMFIYKRIMMLVLVVLFVTYGVAQAVTDNWYVDPNGDDDNDGKSWSQAFATIQEALVNCSDANDDIIDVNSGTYDSNALTIYNNNITFSFQIDVNIVAKTTLDANGDPIGNSEDSNSFRYQKACLFKAIEKDNIVFDGNDTLFEMNMDEYPGYMANLGFNSCSDVNIDSNAITIEDHGLRLGDAIGYTNYYGEANSISTDMESGHWYYAIPKDSNTIKVAATWQDAIDGNELDLQDPCECKSQKFYGGSDRHGIGLYGCTNVDINDLIIRKSGGDGIFVNRSTENVQIHCDDILISDVNCDNNYRCGIAVISVNDLTIEGCTLKGTNGTSPRAGIDFEPYLSTDRLTNIVMRDCSVENNGNHGIVVSTHALTSGSEDIDILIEDCNVTNSHNNIRVSSRASNPAGGLIRFRNVDVNGTGGGIYIYQKSAEGALAVFEECDLRYVAGTPVLFQINYYNVTQPWSGDLGGVEFIACRVLDDKDSAAVVCKGYWGVIDDLYDVTGDIYVSNPNLIPDDPSDEDDPNCLFDWNGASTSGVTLTVEPMAYNVDQDEWYASIQSAINDSSSSDVVEVSPCTHDETIDFANKAITVRSNDPTDSDIVNRTVINAEGENYGVSFDGTESSSSILKGFTITGAARSGIYCSGTSPTIEDCNVVGNGGSSYDGGGMYNDDASPTVARCIFTGNTGDWGGGMFNEDDSSPTVVNCVFAGNYAGYGGGMNNYNSSTEVINCLFYDNDADSKGGGMYIENLGDVNIINCTFYDNYAVDYGGGIYCYDTATVYIRNCILWNNQAGIDGGEVYNDDCDVYVYYSCFEDGINGSKCGGDSLEDEGGEEEEDPNFVNPNDPDGADNLWGTSDDGLVPTPGDDNPVDEGNNDYVDGIDEDIKGDARIINGDVDMGAYEYVE